MVMVRWMDVWKDGLLPLSDSKLILEWPQKPKRSVKGRRTAQCWRGDPLARRDGRGREEEEEEGVRRCDDESVRKGEILAMAVGR